MNAFLKDNKFKSYTVCKAKSESFCLVPLFPESLRSHRKCCSELYPGTGNLGVPNVDWNEVWSPCVYARLVKDYVEAVVAVGKGWKSWGKKKNFLTFSNLKNKCNLSFMVCEIQYYKWVSIPTLSFNMLFIGFNK